MTGVAAESKVRGVALKDISEPKADDAGIGAIQGTDNLHRRLSNRQVQFIAIGASVGTGVFVTVGTGLFRGGPVSLVLAWVLYTCVMCLVNNCMAEMSVYMPISGSFVRMAGKWVDDAFGFMTGWNFFLYECVLIPFEISALTTVVRFWRDDIPEAAICGACCALYLLINVFAVGIFGEAEFYLASGKVLLIIMLFFFTFITMVGGNPQHDAYGFRHWKDPGPFAEYISTGSMGRWEGFLGALWIASFAITGPEYVAMASGEAKNPRRTLKTAFKWTYFRFFFFFVGTALCTSILVPSNDPILKAVVTGENDTGAASASPYIIAMENMGVKVFPHIATVLLITTIFSAGNAYTYCATRTLYSLSLDGQAPRFFQKTTKAGVPIYCLLLTMVFPLLSFLTVSNGTATVITWLVNIVTAAQVLDYITICTTYLRFYQACKAQNVNRSSLPYYGWGQPYCALVALVFMTALVCGYGYEVFLPGRWDVGNFFTYYTMVLLAPVLYIGWKVAKKTKMVNPKFADLVWDAPIIDAMEEEERNRDEEMKGNLWKRLRPKIPGTSLAT